MKRHEKPLRRVNPSGRVVWVARWTDKTGKRRAGWPPDIAGTFELKREAQAAIDACYERESAGNLRGSGSVGSYFYSEWLRHHPRSERTERSYVSRVRAVLDVKLDGLAFREWMLGDVTRPQVRDLLDVLLTDQGRAASGAKGVLVVLSAMWEDAMDDGLVGANPFKGVKVRASDRRVQKAPRVIRTYSWEQMHAFCAASPAEPMLRVLADCGLRLGELLALERADWHGDMLEVRRIAYDGRTFDGTKNDHGESMPGREVPVSPALEELLRAMPKRIDTRLLFPTASGKLWRESNFYRDLWYPTLTAAGFATPAEIREGRDGGRKPGPTPHSFRHSYVSLMRAAGVDPADLADMTGHTVETATQHYTHALRRSFDAARAAVGG